MKTKRKIKKRQFSLLEIIIAISIVALIVAIAAPSVLQQGEKAKVDACKTEIQSLKSTIMQYKIDTGKFPQSLEELATGSDGRKALLKKVPKDPWNNDYIFELNPEAFDGFEITSYGPDGQTGGEGINKDIKLTEL